MKTMNAVQMLEIRDGNVTPDRITHNINSSHPLTVAQWELVDNVEDVEVE